MSRMLATTFKDVKVRVNVIAPGVFPSEMTGGDSNKANKTEMDMDSGNPAGRKGEDGDMAATILFLAGKGGVFYNHQILVSVQSCVVSASEDVADMKLVSRWW